MSRLGNWFLNVVSPYPRLAGFLHYLRHPRLALAKAWGRLRHLRTARRSRTWLDGQRLLVEVGQPGDHFFSVITPVWRVAREHLEAAIQSVRCQSYPHWELWLANDASPDPHVAEVLAAAAAQDPRIHSLHLRDNQGIAGASDALLGQARGEYVAFLDHDDLLHPRALELVSAYLAHHPEADWLFTDEDKVDEAGRHREPCLKPGWSRHLLLSFNYVAHLRVVRRALLERVGRHRRGLDGAQDYDLALRVLAAGGKFHHLRGVLYHWRAVPGSMARAAADKPAAHAHALRALAEHARGWPQGAAVSARVVLPPASFFAVRRLAPAELTVTLLSDAPVAPGGRIGETLFLPVAAGWEEMVETVARAHSPVVVRWPAGTPPTTALEELLALLQVPETALVAPRLVSRGRVSGSGWWLADHSPSLRFPNAPSPTQPLDPWRGLSLDDPGYLNLAMVPGPRAAIAEVAWAGWRDSLLAAWADAEGVPSPWRLAAGLARAGQEVVTTPTVSLPYRAPAPPGAPPPPGLPRHATVWLADLGLSPP